MNYRHRSIIDIGCAYLIKLKKILFCVCNISLKCLTEQIVVNIFFQEINCVIKKKLFTKLDENDINTIKTWKGKANETMQTRFKSAHQFWKLVMLKYVNN